MPFSKYFHHTPRPHHSHPPSLQFQLPAFIQTLTGPPPLAPGGGAEVLTFNPTWFANNNGLPPPVDSNIYAPSPLGLPVYSASGFDILSILARVTCRPNPRVVLGPVDMTCSFVVVDIRRHDQPIVYCSPTFCRLTGYSEDEVLGRNCRFLQAPPSSGSIRAGEPRRFTSQGSVDTMRKALLANKEVQTSIVNFRKDGSAFINLVSVIPIFGGEHGAHHELTDVVYHVGFQVDLTEQPNVILDKLRDGSYTQNAFPVGPAAPYTDRPPPHDIPPPPPRKHQLPALLMAPSLSHALTNPSLHRSLPITTSTTALSPITPTSTTPPSTNNPLSLLLLEYAPDFILVVSLKGAFLYVAPAISHILGHAPSSLVGRSISDLAHPEDVVPLERQLKESSALVPTDPDPPPHHHPQHAKLIDVLFRARTAGGSYVWVEARGRLHVEPGKGRKAIVLSARARRMPRVRWGDLLPPVGVPGDGECWTTLSGIGKAAGAIVSGGGAVERVLGWKGEDVVGRRIAALVVREDREIVEGVLREIERREHGSARIVVFVRVRVRVGGEEGVERVRLAFYPTTNADSEAHTYEGSLGIAPPVILLHIARGSGIDRDNAASSSCEHAHDPEENVFRELEVSRGSSWQYELQQMRFRNKRLREEVRVLEGEVGAWEGVGASEETPTIVGYDVRPQAEQTHVNYERYEGGMYGTLEVEMGLALGIDAGMGMGMDASYTYTHTHSQHQHQQEHEHGHHTQLSPQPHTTYDPQSHSLLHALGPPGQPQSVPRVYYPNPNPSPNPSPRVRPQAEREWVMHPGVKRAFGGR